MAGFDLHDPDLAHAHFTNDLQVTSLNTYTKRRQANQSLNGCVNMGPLGAFEVAWVLGLPSYSAPSSLTFLRRIG